MTATLSAVRPERKTADEIVADLEAHLTDLENDESRIKDERERTKAALTALTPRRKPGRPAKVA